QVEQAGWELRRELLVQRQGARGNDGGDLFGQVFADSGYLGQVGAAPDLVGEGPRVVAHDPGGVTIRPDAKRILVLYFEEIGDFVEQRGEGGVLDLGEGGGGKREGEWTYPSPFPPPPSPVVNSP